MTNIKINRNDFENLIEKGMTDEELSEKASMLGAHWTKISEDKWQVEVYPDRPDLLSVEGLARAYGDFFETGMDTDIPEPEDGEHEIAVSDGLKEIRPHIGCAVISGLNLDKTVLNGLIQMQEKMHQTMGRKRSKMAIGLHDYDKMESPLKYEEADPETEFQPLGRDQSMSLHEVLEQHSKGEKYGHIVEEFNEFPVIRDNTGQIISFPPIINSDTTEVTDSTEKIFVDVTGTDNRTVKTALNIVVLSLEMRGGKIETVNVDGEKMPQFERQEIEIPGDYIEEVVGIEVEPSEVAKLLDRMGYEYSLGDNSILAKPPPQRQDIMHKLDVAEDVAIAYGYDKIEASLPQIDQEGGEDDRQKLTRSIRDSLVGYGAVEAHTHVLSSVEKQYEDMNRAEDQYIGLENPLNENFSMVRTAILPELLRSAKMNRDSEYPQTLFEVSQITQAEGGQAVDYTNLAFLSVGQDADFNKAKEALQVVERDTGIEMNVKDVSKAGSMDGSRSAGLYVEDQRIGIIGELTSEVLNNWDIEEDASGFEIRINPFF